MAQLGKAVVHLEDISNEFFGLSATTAKNYAKAGRLPVPAYRTCNSNKAPWLVNVSDLAQYMDKQRDIAKRDQINAA